MPKGPSTPTTADKTMTAPIRSRARRAVTATPFLATRQTTGCGSRPGRSADTATGRQQPAFAHNQSTTSAPARNGRRPAAAVSPGGQPMRRSRPQLSSQRERRREGVRAAVDDPHVIVAAGPAVVPDHVRALRPEHDVLRTLGYKQGSLREAAKRPSETRSPATSPDRVIVPPGRQSGPAVAPLDSRAPGRGRPGRPLPRRLRPVATRPQAPVSAPGRSRASSPHTSSPRRTAVAAGDDPRTPDAPSRHTPERRRQSAAPCDS